MSSNQNLMEKKETPNADCLQRLVGLPASELRNRIAAGRELLQHAKSRGERALAVALESNRLGDDENVWFGMAARKENQRFIDGLTCDLTDLEAALARLPNVES